MTPGRRAGHPVTSDAQVEETVRNLGDDREGLFAARACTLVGIYPGVYRYRSTRPDDAELRHRLREMSSERRPFSYRRLHWEVN